MSLNEHYQLNDGLNNYQPLFHCITYASYKRQNVGQCPRILKAEWHYCAGLQDSKFRRADLITHTLMDWIRPLTVHCKITGKFLYLNDSATWLVEVDGSYLISPIYCDIRYTNMCRPHIKANHKILSICGVSLVLPQCGNVPLHVLGTWISLGLRPGGISDPKESTEMT